MAKITHDVAVNTGTHLFKKGDLVLLKDRWNHLPEYKNRPVIVTEDVLSYSSVFSGFCLVDNEPGASFRVESFELATKGITLSN